MKRTTARKPTKPATTQKTDQRQREKIRQLVDTQLEDANGANQGAICCCGRCGM